MRHLALCGLAGWTVFFPSPLRAACGEGPQPLEATSSQDSNDAGPAQPAGAPAGAQPQPAGAPQDAGPERRSVIIGLRGPASQKALDGFYESLRKMQLELQQKLPFEDLRQRLAYEGRSDVYTTDPLEKPQRPPLKKPEGPGEPTFTLNSLNERRKTS